MNPAEDAVICNCVLFSVRKQLNSSIAEVCSIPFVPIFCDVRATEEQLVKGKDPVNITKNTQHCCEIFPLKNCFRFFRMFNSIFVNKKIKSRISNSVLLYMVSNYKKK